MVDGHASWSRNGFGRLDGSRTDPTDDAAWRVHIRRGAEETLIMLHGEGDLATAPQLSRAMTHAQPNGNQPLVVLDLSALTFLDASFLGVIASHSRCDEIHRLVLRSPSPIVARILELGGLDDLIERQPADTA